jgi:hypothetical protein
MSNTDRLEEIVNHPVARLVHYVILALVAVATFAAKRNVSHFDTQIEFNRLKGVENAEGIKENREDIIRNESGLIYQQRDMEKLQNSLDKLDAKIDKVLDNQRKR